MTALAEPTILTVEDDPIVRADLRHVLEGAGFSVCAGARDGVEAVELAREHRPDAILLDLNLPRLDGAEAARRILHERRVPIVALTGYGRGELLERAFEAGAVGYVLKPFSAPALVEALRDATGVGESRLAAARVREALGYPPEWASVVERRLLDWGTWRIVD